MRDIKRIDLLLEKFEELWKMYPDMRFFQLLGMIDFNYKGDLFYLEDDKFIQALANTIEKYHQQ